MRVAFTVVLIAFVGSGPILAQQSLASFGDTEARRLVEGALAMRRISDAEASVPVLLTNRLRVGLLIPNQWNWRDRTLFRKEVLGVASFGAETEVGHVLLARARGAPVIGDHLIDRPALWNRFGFDPEEQRPALFGLVGLSLAGIGRDLPFGATPDIHQVFDSLFVDPLGPRGPSLYSYVSGRALNLEDPNGTSLLSVEFRPLDPAAGPMTGILWFDARNGRPVRAMIRPHGRWQLNAGLRGLIRRFPLLPKDALGGLDYLVVDYRQETPGVSWPSVARVQGAMYWFGDQAVLPVQIEWELSWASAVPRPREARPPPPLFGAWSFTVDRRALNPFIREMDRLVGPPPPPSLGQTLVRAVASGRFNQVQGVNFTPQYVFPVGARTVLHTEVGIPTSGTGLTGQMGVRQEVYPYSWGIEAYSRLKESNWMETVNGFTSSLTALITGYDDGNYYLARGGGAWFSYGDRPLDGSLNLFYERHSEAPKAATYSLLEPDTLAAPPTVEPDPGRYLGLRGRVDLQLGDDSQTGVLVARLYGQIVTGDLTSASVGTTTDLVGPLPGPFSGGLRVQFSASGGDVPAQALQYLGGYKTIRGYPANAASGESSFIVTGELGTAVPLARIVLFADAGWAGPGGRLFDNDPLTALGVGFSMADGTVRADLAKGLAGGGVWRFYLATSGLF